jgi:glycogen debranching enzyme
MSDTVSILDGSTFVVSDRKGDIDAGPDQPHGFFFRDTRFLSRWVLSVKDQPLEVLSTDDVDYFSAQFFLYPPTGTIYKNPELSVIRKRSVGDGFHEDVIVLNHSNEEITLNLRVEAVSDFADIFEVKDALKKAGELYQELRAGALVLGYRREDFVRETVITSSAPAKLDEHGLSLDIAVAAHGSWETCLDVMPGADLAPRHKHGHGSMHNPVPNMKESLGRWIAEAPELESSWDKLGHIYWRSLVDLAALRFYPDILPGASVPAAGLPWFMALFGRDSIITSYQALPFVPELAATTLRVLAARQGENLDAFRDEEPGKILHELRVGELTHFGERPHSPYYGACDATPLWLVLLDEYERWTGDADLVIELEPNARNALRWIDEYGDRDGDGYVEYERANHETGLENQCWKDSWNSILFSDGTNSVLPRATCEIQGYVYDAKRRCARLARQVWGDERLAERLEAEAIELKHRFNEDFWVAERECFAVALDGQKRKVDSITSNIGHLLWSGIVDDQKGAAVARHLMSERMFSGWGVRTMAEGEGAYNPIEYHNGTVWPHDNAFIAAGLRRYGYAREAATIAYALLEAATYFDWRLPEVFAGYPRSLTEFPVEYPTACTPQAWATGTPLLLLRVLLGLEPDGDRLACDPVLPGQLDALVLRRVPGRWGRAATDGHSREQGVRRPTSA